MDFELNALLADRGDLQLRMADSTILRNDFFRSLRLLHEILSPYEMKVLNKSCRRGRERSDTSAR